MSSAKPVAIQQLIESGKALKITSEAEAKAFLNTRIYVIAWEGGELRLKHSGVIKEFSENVQRGTPRGDLSIYRSASKVQAFLRSSVLRVLWDGQTQSDRYPVSNLGLDHTNPNQVVVVSLEGITPLKDSRPHSERFGPGEA